MGQIGVMKATLIIAVRLLLLTIIYFVCFAAVSAALLSSRIGPSNPSNGPATLAPLLLVSFLNTLVLGLVIIRSSSTGGKLILAIFIILFGVTTVMSQIETAFFITRLPTGFLPRLFVSGAIVAALYSLLAVFILGKRKSSLSTGSDRPRRFDMTVNEWVAKLLLIVIAYIVIYFSFGYFIAWRNPAVRAYYGGQDPGSFLAQMTNVLRDTPWLLPFQAVRAILWTAIAVLVIRLMKGRWWESGLAVTLLFAVVMTSQLLIT